MRSNLFSDEPPSDHKSTSTIGGNWNDDPEPGAPAASTSTTDAELDFAQVAMNHSENVPWGRMIETIMSLWRQHDPDTAPEIKQEQAGPPEPTFQPGSSEDQPCLDVAWLSNRMQLKLPHARALALQILQASEVAETQSFLILHFGKARDHELAQKILASLLPRWNEYRQANLAGWLRKCLADATPALSSE